MKKLYYLLGLIAIVSIQTAFCSEPPPAMTPDEAIQRLKEGNERFVSGKPLYPHTDAAYRKTLAKMGHGGFGDTIRTFAAVIGCVDSRIPVEYVFDAGFGDIFCVRNGANTVTSYDAGLVEYSLDYNHTPVCVVLGHTACGAYPFILEEGHSHPNLYSVVNRVAGVSHQAKAMHPGLSDEELAEKAGELNVWQAIDNLFRFSPVVRERVTKGKLKVIGAMYDLETGKVNFMGEYPKQAKLLEGLRGHDDKYNKRRNAY